MGFVYRENMFQLIETLEQPLHFTVFVQKNVHSETYKIGLDILVRSPLLSTSRWRVFLSAHLLAQGIRFHAPADIWWSPTKLSEALVALRRYALPWFQAWRSPTLLLEKLEASIEQRKSLTEVVEPLNPEQEEALQRAWPHVLNSKPAVPVISYFSASVLHYLVGNKEMSIRRTEDWIRRLGPNDESERAEALNQLSALRDKPIQEFKKG